MGYIIDIQRKSGIHASSWSISSIWTCYSNSFEYSNILMLLGIYSLATLVSANNNLRKSIYKQAMESKLLGLIGDAEMGKLIEKTVKVISRIG